MRCYLVTGGAGFIGSNLVEALLTRGCKVIVIDNLSTGALANLDGLLDKITFIEGSITDPNVFNRISDPIDGIFHLAAMSKVLPSLDDPSMIGFCQLHNVNGTLNVLDYARRYTPPIKVVYSSTCAIYGNNPAPNSEIQAPDCQSPYALSKYIAEQYCILYSRLYGVPTIRLRYFMVFGPREPDQGSYAVVSGIFFRRLLSGLPLLINGDGLQTRDFVHVHDVCLANILAMENRAYSETINVGTGRSTSIKALANLISCNQEHNSPRSSDMRESTADTTKLREVLHWVPESRITQYITSRVSLVVGDTLCEDIYSRS